MIRAADIRSRYVEFFTARGHRHVASAPLVPPDDPTLLFTTAGMVQFKRLYSGDVPLPYTRAVTVQKSLRAGGKGSDLENVGRTLRHHTFFEMLGNFSFGDYFKKETIEWAWEFCTGAQWLNLPAERIWATVFGKPDGKGGWVVDDEAEGFWRGTGLVNPIVRLDETENFWGPAGGAGACGPCSEIKFFMGSDEELRRYQELARSGDEGLAKVAHDLVEIGDLFLEIWNLVFPQFDHQLDGSRPPLKNRGIDTGAGLERVTTACQMIASGGKVNSPYETDLLEPIVRRVSEIAGMPYPRLRGGEAEEAALRERGLDPAAVRLAMNACADHARALVFTLAEGIVPSNEGRGYVMRRILRRAARFGRKLGVREPFLHRLVDPVVEVMGDVYPELRTDPARLAKIVRLEEERFNRTLHMGGDLLDQIMAGREAGATITGDEAYRLYDTYGFPLELTIETAEERGLRVDEDGFAALLAEGRKRAKASWKGGGGADYAAALKDLKDAGRRTEFVGYDATTARAKVLAVLRGAAGAGGGMERAEALEEGASGVVVLDRTPFYGEGGGQVGDTGVLRLALAEGESAGPEGAAILFRVEDTQKTEEGFFLHFGHAEDRVAPGAEVSAEVDADRRWETMKHHSATHLLQGALKRVVGAHVTQSGSHVGPDALRFDFTNPEAIDDEKLRAIERIVNEQVQRNLPIRADEMDIEEARRTGAIAPFGEKYGARVRVVRMGDFSTEFCGGTHLRATGEVGAFVVVGESSVAAGIRRIEARTGRAAEEAIQHDRAILRKLSRAMTAKPDELVDRVGALQAEIKKLRRDLEQAKTKQASGQATAFRTETIAAPGGDVTVVSAWIDDADAKVLRATWDGIKSKNPARTLALLGSGSKPGGEAADAKSILVAGATDDLAGTPCAAGEAIKRVAALVGASGGGKPAFAQAGGKDPATLKAALEDGRLVAALRG